MAPVQEVGLRGIRRWGRQAQSFVIFCLLDVNDWLIGRFAGGRSPIYPTSQWPWIPEVEAATPQIRREIEEYAPSTLLPQVAAVSGLDPDTEEGKLSIPGLVGTWRTVILFANGAWIDETARHFPRTVECFRSIHPKANVGFSALEPRSHIEAHVGPNRGALRFQLPVIVPGELGDCRIRIGEDVVKWREAEAIVFDLSTNHEAWNDTDHLRVLLMVEIPMPLPPPLKWCNRLAQYSYRWHPSYRGMPDRIAAFARQRDTAMAGADADRAP